MSHAVPPWVATPGGAVMGPGAASVPVLSPFKRWDWRANRSLEYDILVPTEQSSLNAAYFYPEAKKIPKAMLRAALQISCKHDCLHNCSQHCIRLRLFKLQRGGDPDAARLLDIGIHPNRLEGERIEEAAYIPMEEHARWRYLISTDGYTASCRFGKVLKMNSVVLKEPSPWIEWYYRSVVPDMHFATFNGEEDILKVIQALDADPRRRRAISDAGQRFAYKYTRNHGKTLYVAGVFQAYNELFRSGDLMDFLGTLDGRNLPTTIEDLLHLMKRFLDARKQGR